MYRWHFQKHLRGWTLGSQTGSEDGLGCPMGASGYLSLEYNPLAAASSSALLAKSLLYPHSFSALASGLCCFGFFFAEIANAEISLSLEALDEHC